jgi:ADP-heptose:LPS heptosyltransferase
LLLRALIGWLRYLASLKASNKFLPSEVRSVLLIELSRLGDVMVMLPSLTRFKMHFPKARIRVLVDERYVSLLRSSGIGCGCEGISDAHTARGTLLALKLVRSEPIDLAVSMSPPRRNAFITLASRSRMKVGYLSYVDSVTPFLVSTPVESFGFSTSSKTQYSNENIYKRSARICEALGIGGGEKGFVLEIEPADSGVVREDLRSHGLLPDRPYVLLHPFSGWEFRQWGLSQFRELAERIRKSDLCDVVVVCEQKDYGVLIRALGPASQLKVVLTSDLLKLAVLMKGSVMFVGNDSGPLHLAEALGIRTIGLFGPAPPELTGGQSARSISLYKKLDCSPCDQRTCVRPEKPCMSYHEVDEVFAAVVAALQIQVHERSLNVNGQGISAGS